jgi:uncharacterized protein YndB with AHSA1/START domain
MTVTNVHKDPEALTMTITVELDASVERAWQLWADPRQLERWWGPPMYPATFVDHDLKPGALVTYFMTSPEGQKHYGWWEVIAVDAPTRLEVKDGFADDTGKPKDDLVGRMVVTLNERDSKTVMDITSHFPSAEVMEQLLSMGQEEGMVQALGQIEGILAGDESS